MRPSVILDLSQRHDRRLAIRYALLWSLTEHQQQGQPPSEFAASIKASVQQILEEEDVFFTGLLATRLCLPSWLTEGLGKTRKAGELTMDSTLKRNLSFVKRLKAGDVSVMKDLTKLKLDPYLSEIVAAILESLTSLTTAANLDSSSSRKLFGDWSELIVLLHARFGMGFTHPFLTQFYRTLVDNRAAVIPIPAWPPSTANYVDREIDAKAIPGLSKKYSPSNTVDTPTAASLKATSQSQKVLLRIWMELWYLGLLDVYAWSRAKMGTIRQPVLGRSEDMGLGAEDSVSDASHQDSSFLHWQPKHKALPSELSGRGSFFNPEEKASWWITTLLPWQNDLLGVALRELVITSLSSLKRVCHSSNSQTPSSLALGLGLATTFAKVLTDELGLKSQLTDAKKMVIFGSNCPGGEGQAKLEETADSADSIGLSLVLPKAITVSAFHVLRRATVLWLRHIDYEFRQVRSLHSRHNDWYYVKGSDPPEDFKQRYERDLKGFFHDLGLLRPLLELFPVEFEPFEFQDDGTDKILARVSSDTNVPTLCRVVGSHECDLRESSPAGDEDIVVGAGAWEDEGQRDFYELLTTLGSLHGSEDPECEPTSDKLASNAVGATVESNEPEQGKEADPKQDLEDTLAVLPTTQSQQLADSRSRILFACIQRLEGVNEKRKETGKKAKDEEELPLTLNWTSRPSDPPSSELSNAKIREANHKSAAALSVRSCKQKILRALTDIPKFRHDLLPYYARIVANLSQVYPEIGEAMVDILSRDFKYVRKSAKGPTDPMRSDDLAHRTLIYLGELVKFSRSPPYVIFFCLQELLNHNSIDLTCRLLDTCGRFLYTFSKMTRYRLKCWLDVLMRKKEKRVLDSRTEILIQNAYQNVIGSNRGTDSSADNKTFALTLPNLIKIFSKKLVYHDLNKKTTEKILKLLRKLPWEGVMVPVDKEEGPPPSMTDEQSLLLAESQYKFDPDFVSVLMHRTLLKCWKIRYSNLKLLAMLACGLAKYHPEFGVRLVDALTEEIRTDLERNTYKRNQRRVSCIRYLGELYNYRMFDSALIFDTLFGLISYGHVTFPPRVGQGAPSDAPSDSIRIRLVCVLLETCGRCFDRGRSRKRLDMFLEVFMVYLWSKLGLAMDVWYVVMDTVQLLRPKFEIPKSYEDSAVRLAAIEAEIRASGSDKEVAEDEEDDAVGLDDAMSADDRPGNDDSEEELEESYAQEEEVLEGDEEHLVDMADDDEEDLPDSSDDEEDIFERELRAMTEKSLEQARKNNPLPEGTPIPRFLADDKASERRKSTLADQAVSKEDDMAETPLEDASPGNVELLLLSKRAVDQPRKLILPATTALSQNAQRHLIQKEREEKEFRQLVLDYEGWGTEEQDISNIRLNFFGRAREGSDGPERKDASERAPTLDEATAKGGIGLDLSYAKGSSVKADGLMNRSNDRIQGPAKASFGVSSRRNAGGELDSRSGGKGRGRSWSGSRR